MAPCALSVLWAVTVLATRVIAQSEVLASTPLVDKHYSFPSGLVSDLYLLGCSIC